MRASFKTIAFLDCMSLFYVTRKMVGKRPYDHLPPPPPPPLQTDEPPTTTPTTTDSGELATETIIGIAIAGAVVAVVIVICIICFCYCCCLRSSRREDYIVGGPRIVARYWDERTQHTANVPGRTGSTISRGSRGSRASFARSSISSIGSILRFGSKKKKREEKNLMEPSTMTVTPL